MSTLILIIATIGTTNQPADGDAFDDRVLGVYATKGGNTSQGTGFLVSAHGDILTCYHVIQGANKISVSFRGHEHPASIDSIAPDFDLARLHIYLKEPAPFFTCETEQSSVTKILASSKLNMIGYSRILRVGPQMKGWVKLTTPDLVKSDQVRGLEGEIVFLKTIDIMMLSTENAVYGGYSGSPIIAGDAVVGVFSGSFTEGGTTSWAIPTSYLSQLKASDVPSAGGAWPRSNLYADSGWYRAVSALTSRKEAPLWLIDLVDGINDIEPIIKKYQAQVRQTHAVLGTLRDKIESMLAADEITMDDFKEFKKLKLELGNSLRALDGESKKNDRSRLELLTLLGTFQARIDQDENFASMNRAFTDRIRHAAARLTDLSQKQKALDSYVETEKQFDASWDEFSTLPQAERTLDRLRDPLGHLLKAYEHFDRWFQLTANHYTDMRQVCRDASVTLERVRFQPLGPSRP